ncbi:MAG TPA: hypothetical protein VLA85_21295 [Verrucomicrobiae bacterium]|jgi:hypothetical protein|nr:hypothetical protein [Verrucomicrobiae bacterium]
MALCWVKVIRSDGGGISDSVYVDGNYADIAGAIGTPFRTETGQNTFETLDAGLAVTWQKTLVIKKPPDNQGSNPVLVTLDPAVSA